LIEIIRDRDKKGLLLLANFHGTAHSKHMPSRPQLNDGIGIIKDSDKKGLLLLAYFPGIAHSQQTPSLAPPN